jgi:lipopolysaccharide biosynthesis glycosyltransferase
MRDAVANWEALALDPDAPYFNSGVLLIDLVAWRAAEVSQRALFICEEHSDRLLAQGKWPQYDQYGLNVTLMGRWKELEQVWNYGTDMPPFDARIVHYIGNGKIGLPTCHPHFSRLFFSMLSRTPYRDWLPQPVA